MSTQTNPISGQLDVDALGRPCFLGQLYQASTGILFNECLFPTAVVNESIAPKASAGETEFWFREIRNTKDATSALDISASISVSVLGGSLDLKGSGSFIDRSKNSESSITIAGIVKRITDDKRLELNDFKLRSAVAIKPERLKQLGATHVVMGITYGATMIGSVTETSSSYNMTRDIEGHFSMKMLENLGGLGGAKGAADLNLEERKRLESYEVEMRLTGDYLDPDPLVKVPVDVISLSQKLKQGGELLAVGIPTRLRLMPLKLFNNVSAELIFQELAAADLDAIMVLYDRIVALYQQRSYLLEQVNGDEREYFPTLRARCQERSLAAELLLVESRGKLGIFLRNYRSSVRVDSFEATTAFTDAVSVPLNTEATLYDKDLILWKTLLGWKRTASINKFPLMTASKLSSLMNSKDRNPVGLVLIPPSARTTILLDMYQNLVESIEKWYSQIKLANGSDASLPIQYCSIYADSLADDFLFLLDGEHGVLKSAVLSSRENSTPCFLSFNLAKKVKYGATDWMSSANGWGILREPGRKSNYIGELLDSQPHGSGLMVYSDGRYYEGSWFQGNYDGRGRVMDGTGQVQEEGIFVDGVLEDNGILVNVSVYDENTSLIDAKTVAIVCHSPETTLITEIESFIPAQIEKFARAFNWQAGQRHELSTTWEAQVYWIPMIEGAPEGIPVPNFFDRYVSKTKVITAGTEKEKFVHYEDPNPEFTPKVLNWDSWLQGLGLTKGSFGGWEIKPMYNYGDIVSVEAVVLPDRV